MKNNTSDSKNDALIALQFALLQILLLKNEDSKNRTAAHSRELFQSTQDSKTPVAMLTGSQVNIFMSSEEWARKVKYHGSMGHGFAAEDANHMHDILSGESAKIIGDDNAKFGADRLVNNQEIQTKYWSNGSKCVATCFKDGQFIYFDRFGNPMQIEVPSDCYEAALKAMEIRIRKGQVAGIDDINEAKNIIRKGSYTYEQAKNIAKAGNLDISNI
ncbi:hypothetical protein [Vibrio sp. D431a]|uniref:hypothetical protein n=1 Tax=Vibrio sp. D431a TaxID=2837388 RepID=UPI0025566F1B|nr:hypothetical protein [Vibrio sp. D431a]MDK9789873.1 hypothetical protein [Vibrio sp. D431a]